jgi:hypothetical protein
MTTQRRAFMDLVLDEAGLHTPDGDMPIGTVTRAESVRHRQRPSAAPGSTYSGYSPAGAVGGAVVGGALAGPVGFLAGGLLGSTIGHDKGHDTDSGAEGIPRTVSASLIFESPDLAYSTIVSKDRVEEAEAFVAAVKTAAGLR